MAHDQDVRWPAAIVTLVVVLGTVPATAADAATIPRTGWWTRNPVASAPDGGFDVSMGPDGAPLSIAALEVAARGTVTRAVLTLAEDGGIAQQDAALVVCVTTGEWTSGAAQPMEDAPVAACGASTSVTMTRNTATSTWAADVTPLLGGVARDGTASLMVVPAVSTAAPLGFDVRLRPPQLQSEVQDGAVATSSTTTSTTAATTPPTSTTSEPRASSPTTSTTTGADGYDPSVAAAGRPATAAAPASTTSAVVQTAPLPSEEPEGLPDEQRALATRHDDDGDGASPHPWVEVAFVLLAADLALLVVQRAQRASIGTKSRRSGPA